MENSSPLILEISSDEEAGFGDSSKGSGFDVGDGEDCDWLSKLLWEVGGNADDDSDDVVVLSEVFPKAPKISRSESLKPSDKVVDVKSDDDDCVILDCDPDKPVAVVNCRVEDDGESDDLEIVGEKGEVACRDFPHARHLCAKFHFASTPHEVHCGQCHCYVCDSLAPCSQWGSGTASIDHCHASDKDEYWRGQRKRVKKADKPVPEIPTPSGTYRMEAFFPRSQVPAPARPQPSSLVQNLGFNPVTIHPRPISSNFSVSNAINQVRTHPPGYAVPRYKPRSHLTPLQSHPTSNENVASSVASRGESHHVGTPNPRTFPSSSVFRRHGLVGQSPNNRHAYGSQLSGNPSLKRRRAFQTPVVNGCHSSNQQTIGSHTSDSVIPLPKLSSLHSMNVGRANYLPSRPVLNSHLDRDPIQHQSQMPAQPYVTRKISSSAPLLPNISSQPRVESINNLVFSQPHVFQPNNPAQSQAVASYQSDAGHSFGNLLHPRSMISSHSVASNNLENHSSQPQAHYSPTSLLMDGQNDIQQGNQTQNGINVTSTYFSFFQDSSLDNGNVQIHAEESQCLNTEPAETLQLQNEQENDHHITVAPVCSFSQQSVVLADFTSLLNDDDSQFPGSTGPGPLDFQFGSCMIENQPLSGAMDAFVSPNWNVFSPEPSFIDTGTLFDI